MVLAQTVNPDKVKEIPLLITGGFSLPFYFGSSSRKMSRSSSSVGAWKLSCVAPESSRRYLIVATSTPSSNPSV